MKNKIADIDRVSKMMTPLAGFSDHSIASRYPASTKAKETMYGMQSLWLAAFADLDETAAVEYAALVLAAVLLCLFLLWNFILRKRFAKYKRVSSSQGERYRQFFENCPDALVVVEHDGCIVTANDQACRLLKMDSQDLLAKTFWDFTAPVSRPEFGKQFTRCISGKKIRCEGDVRASDGTVVPVELNGSLQRIDGKSLVQLYIRDNSVLREVEDQVRSLYNQLDKATAEMEAKEKTLSEELNHVRREYIAFANHQIRTPLDGIMGMAQLLTDTPLNFDQHNCVYSILKSSARLLNVVVSMSEAYEDNSGDNALRSDYVNLRSICDSLAKQYEPLAIHKEIDFRCDCHDNVPLRVVADRGMLRQVLSALLDNAIKFTEQGLVMLNIECRRKDGDSAEIYFQVIDTGIGIDKECQSSIFEKNHQDVENRFERSFGSELGLAAGRQMVEQMGGTIGLTSTKGRGSTFCFGLTLPLELPQSLGNAKDELEPAGVSKESDIRDALVLLVDDNKISQKVVAAMLRKEGCVVDAVGNGKQALSQIRKKDYDVVLMDCQMPVMDGHEATAAIRSMTKPHRSVPIVALTAHSLKHELEACRKSGMDGHLVKPVDRRKLVETVDTFTRKRRKELAMEFKAAS